MKLTLGSSLLAKIPGIKFHCFLVKNINNLRKSSTVAQLVRGAAVVAKNELKKNSRKDFFETFIDHTLEPDSTLLESYLLVNRIKKTQTDKEIQTTNNLANLINYFSYKYLLPVFGFDLDEADQDYQIDFYQPKKGKKSPELNFTAETRHAIFWFPNITHLSAEELEKIYRDIENNLSKYVFAGVSEQFILDGENLSYDLGYTSEKELAAQRNGAEEEIFARPNSPFGDEIIINAPTVVEEPNEEQTSGSILNQVQDDVEEKLPAAFEEGSTLLLTETLGQLVKETLLNYYKGNEEVAEIVRTSEIETPKDLKHGDFAYSVAMKLAKRLGKAPLDLAVELKSILPQPGYISEISVLPPGFINFHLAKEYLATALDEINKNEADFGTVNLGKGAKVMIEFGSLNIAKPFGAHHLMTTVIGQTLVNLFRATGYNVVAADWPGDIGTQFGNLIYAYKTWGNPKVVTKDPINELLKLYVQFHEEAEKDPSIEEHGREEYRKLVNQDPDNVALWQWIVAESIKEADQIYATLGVKHDWRKGESLYIEPANKLLEKFKAEGKIVEGEKGAYVIKLEEENLPDLLMQKGDGTNLYATRDLASIDDRCQDQDLKKLIYVVDVAQTLHFNQIFAAARKLGLSSIEMKHVIYGRMQLPEGSMSTRKGTIVLGKDLLTEAVNRAAQIIKEKGLDLNPKEQKQVAQEMAISAIKYAMIVQAPESNFTFEWDKVLSFDGNSAPYLEYSLARAKSIARKAGLNPDLARKKDLVEEMSSEVKDSAGQISLFSIEDEQKVTSEINAKPFDSELEVTLCKELLRFEERLASAVNNFKPNLFTFYLFELSQTFNSFYQAVPVLRTANAELREFRLKLVKGVEIALEKGLKILGLAVFEKM